METLVIKKRFGSKNNIKTVKIAIFLKIFTIYARD